MKPMEEESVTCKHCGKMVKKRNYERHWNTAHSVTNYD